MPEAVILSTFARPSRFQPPQATHGVLLGAAGADAILSLLPQPGSHATLDAAIDLLASAADRPYDIIASLVKRRVIAVEFEASRSAFPFRRILVRRL